MEELVEMESRNQNLTGARKPTNGRNGRRTEVQEQWIPVSPRLGHSRALGGWVTR